MYMYIGKIYWILNIDSRQCKCHLVLKRVERQPPCCCVPVNVDILKINDDCFTLVWKGRKKISVSKEYVHEHCMGNLSKSGLSWHLVTKISPQDPEILPFIELNLTLYHICVYVCLSAHCRSDKINTSKSRIIELCKNII